MRTTLDIADDVLQAAREQAKRERKTIGEMLSKLARRALMTAHEPLNVKEPKVDRWSAFDTLASQAAMAKHGLDVKGPRGTAQEQDAFGVELQTLQIMPFPTRCSA
jgi:hypothetical protein